MRTWTKLEQGFERDLDSFKITDHSTIFDMQSVSDADMTHFFINPGGERLILLTALSVRYCHGVSHDQIHTFSQVH